MPKIGRTYINQSVSFPPGLLTAAKQRAENLGLSFSAYIQKCIERDLLERGAIIFSEQPERLLAVAEDPPDTTHPKPSSLPKRKK